MNGGGDPAVVSALDAARAVARELLEAAEAAAGVKELAGTVSATELRDHQRRLEQEAAALPWGPLRSARQAAARSSAAWAAYREHWDAVSGPLTDALETATGRLREAQRGGTRQLKRQTPDPARLLEDLAAARDALARTPA
ncbi:hypothetical protein, partial [Streptomyces sp. SBT349]|uniref:hypothetical protein n=1 Tax=Streptomyces sp. SBT349 TaxID=1580539 RepID=UPI00066D9CDB